MHNTVPTRIAPKIRKTSIQAIALATFVILAFAGAILTHADTTPITTTTVTSFSGRAFVLQATAPIVGTVTLADTGSLPSQGGELDASLLQANTPLAQAEVLSAFTTGFGSTAQSEASVANIVLLPGSPNQITADFVRADATATVTTTVSGTVTTTVTTTTTTSQTQTTTSQRVDFMTGGGFIIVNGYHANFGFNAGYKPGKTTVSGQLTYIDHGTGMKVKATSIDKYYNPNGSTGTTRTFSGQAEVNGVSGYYFTVTATDNGEPGKGNDYFSITLTGPNFYYHQGSTLGGGNIQLHR